MPETKPRGGVTGPGTAALRAALAGASYEILPFRSAEEKVLAAVPTSVPLTITTTGARGLDATVELAVRLTGHGYRAAPHLAARLVRDGAHLADLTAHLRDGGVESLFVIGGDAEEPVGDFPDALSLLEGIEALGRPFASVGIGGYPEGHATIADEVIEQAMRDKAPHATQIVTQMCFDAGTTARWARVLAARGVDLPVRVGIPGAVSRQKLIRVSAGLGLGRSARFLLKQQSMFWRFFLPGGYSPDRLVEGVAPALGRRDNGLVGLHVFTFNELESTEAWRQAWLARLP